MGTQVSTVIDASALLAMLFAEPGAGRVADAIGEGAATSTVNLSEVATILIRHQCDAEGILEPVSEQVSVEPFTDRDAFAAATMYPQTASRGLSLGDRSCLALAHRLGVPALTAEHAWTDLPLDIDVQLIRTRSAGSGQAST